MSTWNLELVSFLALQFTIHFSLRHPDTFYINNNSTCPSENSELKTLRQQSRRTSAYSLTGNGWNLRPTTQFISKNSYKKENNLCLRLFSGRKRTLYEVVVAVMLMLLWLHQLIFGGGDRLVLFLFCDNTHLFQTPENPKICLNAVATNKSSEPLWGLPGLQRWEHTGICTHKILREKWMMKRNTEHLHQEVMQLLRGKRTNGVFNGESPLGVISIKSWTLLMVLTVCGSGQDELEDICCSQSSLFDEFLLQGDFISPLW